MRVSTDESPTRTQVIERLAAVVLLGLWALLPAACSADPARELPTTEPELTAREDGSSSEPPNAGQPEAMDAGYPRDQDGVASNAGADGTGDAQDGGPADAGAPRRCAAPEGVSAAPRDYPELLELLNALPRPTTIACFVESLERPLKLSLADSLFSAQPAVGPENPRVFIAIEPMVYSIVPAGTGSVLLETSLLTSDTRSVKAELVFPLEEEVTFQEMARHLWRGSGTVCGLCHAPEVEAVGPEFGQGLFESTALKPREEHLVSIPSLAAAADLCDPALEPERCAILDALFDYGPVEDWTFPEAMITFF